MSMTAYGGSHAWNSEFVTDPLLQRIEDNVTHVKERLDREVQLVDATNAGQYELVVINGVNQVERTATRGQAGPVGVTLQPMTAGGAVQFVRWSGIAEVKIDSAVGIHQPVRPSPTAGRAEACTLGDAGIFGFARTSGGVAGAVIEVILVGASTASGASTRPIWDPHGLAVVPALTDFPTHSHIGGSDAVTQETDRVIIHLAGSVAADEAGIFMALPTIPFTFDCAIIPYVPPDYQFSLVLLENGSDKRSMERVYFNSATGLWTIQDYKYTDYHTASSGGSALLYGGATQPLWMRVHMASSSREFLFSYNGQDWKTKNSDTYTASGFLPSNPTHLGITINTNTISEPGEIHIVHVLSH